MSDEAIANVLAVFLATLLANLIVGLNLKITVRALWAWAVCLSEHLHVTPPVLPNRKD